MVLMLLTLTRKIKLKALFVFIANMKKWITKQIERNDFDLICIMHLTYMGFIIQFYLQSCTQIYEE